MRPDPSAWDDPGAWEREYEMVIPAWLKKVLMVWVWAAMLGHALEAPFAYRAAAKRGLDPWEYFLRTMALGAIALIPLLRKPMPEA
jgi:hypothetical protein